MLFSILHSMRFTEGLFRRRISEGLPSQSVRSRSGTTDFGGVTPPAPGPVTIDLTDLMEIRGDDQFLKACYWRILGREFDAPGLIDFREMLRAHTPRRVILQHFINSDEARQTGRRFIGLPSQKRAMLGHWSRGGVQAWKRFLLSPIRELVHGLVGMTRIVQLEHKVDYLLSETVARADQISAKTDQGLWLLSQKLDANFAALQARHDRLLAEVLDQYRISEGRAQARSERAEVLAEQIIAHENVESQFVAGLLEKKLQDFRQVLTEHLKQALTEHSKMDSAAQQEARESYTAAVDSNG
jgi:hypothetical protein